eukprot:gene4449-5549_t
MRHHYRIQPRIAVAGAVNTWVAGNDFARRTVSKRSGICEHWKTGRTARRNRKNTGSGEIPAMIGSFPEFENCLHDLRRMGTR